MIKEETFVAICPNYYGKGLTKNEAINNAKSAGGRKRKNQYTVYRIECSAAKISINDIDGSISYPKNTVTEKIQTSTLAVKK